jgi:predicted extracellular nuclease
MRRLLCPALLLPVWATAQITPICAIQGPGGTSPYAGQVVTTTGIVTAIHLGAGSLEGYFIEEPGCDGDPATSNGLFVYDPSPNGIAPGDRVEVTGEAIEYQGLTELTNVVAENVVGSGTVTPTDLSLPVPSLTVYERYEGMLLRFPGDLVVTDVSDWAQYGQVTLAPERLVAPTDSIDPNDASTSGTSSSGTGNVAAVTALDVQNTRSMVLLDDGLAVSDPFPPPFMGPEGTLRCGSTITDLVAVLGYAFGEYRLQPAGPIALMHAPRPAVPAVGGGLRVATLNVLNYWTTLGGWGANTGGELTRQRTKLVAALAALDADALVLHELEENNIAYVDLLNALNAAVGSPYAAIDDGATGGGTKSVLFYRTASLTPCTPLYTLSTSLFERHHHTQGFQVNATGGRFLLSTMHLRSKNCGGGGTSDQDLGDGQGCYNGTRKAQAFALADQWSNLRAITGIEAQLVMGDMNAYREEDPVDVLRAAGFTDLGPVGTRTYTFDRTAGALDHALASPALLGAVTGAAAWSINSSEPPALDYRSVNLPFYQPDAFHCSDHDPVLVGLDALLLPVGIDEAGLTQVNAWCDGERIRWRWTGCTDARITLFDALGRTLASFTGHGLDAGHPVDQLYSGVIAWELRCDGARHTGRVWVP